MCGDLLAADGFEVSFQEYKPGRVNVIARMENGAGPVFAFNTHMDVVPAGEGWSSDPFVAEGGRRPALRTRRLRLQGTAGVDAGSHAHARQRAARPGRARCSAFSWPMKRSPAKAPSSTPRAKPKIDAAVIGEPTSNATFSAHKGSLRPVVRVHGVAAHSGTPHLGENAIYRAGELLGLIAEHHETVVRHRSHPLVGAASLTVTRINGGHADNVLPARCDLLLDRRMVPGERRGRRQGARSRDLLAARQRALRPARRNHRIQGDDRRRDRDAASIARSCRRASRRAGPMALPSRGPYGFQGGCDLVHFSRHRRRGNGDRPGRPRRGAQAG